jgi:regulator of protease activity HflC (stomatin/prohibitin superfamily)
MIVLYALAAALGLGVLWLGTNLRVVKQFERGVVFRFGRVQTGVRAPGLTMLIPIADRLTKVNMQIVTMPVPAQDGITRDNVTVRVDAVIYFNVADPVRVAVDVQDYTSAIGQVAQTSLRSIIGKSDLDDLQSNREHLNQGLELMIDSPALGWGVHIDRVEIKDVILPDSMKRSMSRQAEAERERRARIITADGELQASEKLAQAAEVMAEHPAALQLRLLQTVVEVAAEKNSTLVLPFPVELLRFLEKATPQPSGAQHTAATTAAEPAALPNGETPHVETSPIPDDARGLQLESSKVSHSGSTSSARNGRHRQHGTPPSAVGTAGTDGAVTGHRGCLSEVAPPSGHRACRVRAHDMQAGDTMYCCPHCARKSGIITEPNAIARRGGTSNYGHSNHVVRRRRAREADARRRRPLRRPGGRCRNGGPGFGTGVGEWLQVGDR